MERRWFWCEIRRPLDHGFPAHKIVDGLSSLRKANPNFIGVVTSMMLKKGTAVGWCKGHKRIRWDVICEPAILFIYLIRNEIGIFYPRAHIFSWQYIICVENENDWCNMNVECVGNLIHFQYFCYFSTARCLSADIRYLCICWCVHIVYTNSFIICDDSKRAARVVISNRESSAGSTSIISKTISWQPSNMINEPQLRYSLPDFMYALWDASVGIVAVDEHAFNVVQTLIKSTEDQWVLV